MRILITGGLGFQGTNLTKRLLSNKNEVLILDTFSNESFRNIDQQSRRQLDPDELDSIKSSNLCPIGSASGQSNPTK
jgi:nucleoside-diphosphate-sugar epimerase